MCGIAGIIDFEGTNKPTHDELHRMATYLVHRGPDESGLYLDPESQLCALTHRRLSIIDLKHGRQPLCNEDETIWITYNGECYNFLQLRQTLQKLNHRFKTNCDTEVIVHLYEEYGPDCVNHIRGMFAFAIWDQKSRQLFLARDRMGQKPLYYAVHNGRFIFASECKAILQTNNFPRQCDRESIGHYLLLQYVPPPRTAFADIRQLPPAHTLTFSPGNFNDIEPRRYWSIPQNAETGENEISRKSLAESAEHLRSELQEATRLRMISDVPLGAFLSGGLDSTIIVGLMSQINNDPVQTCSIGFEEVLYNETPFARQAAQRFNCDHTEQIVKPDCLDTIEKLSYYYDDPFADSSALPTFHLCHLARNKVTVALTGDGGDECFGGYDRYRALKLAEQMKTSRILTWMARRGFWDKIAGGEHHSFWHRLRRFTSALSLPASQRYLKWIAVFDPDMIRQLVQKNMSIIPPWDYLDPFFQNSYAYENSLSRVMAQAMLADGNTYLPGDLNTKIDRASMSTGLELRCPFQDHKVVELAYSLPTTYRHNGKTGKLILRHACDDLLPEKIKHRKKMGFGVPVGHWFRHELRPLFIDTVLSGHAIQRGYFKRQAVEQLLQENEQKQNDHGHRLWSLLMLELWHRNYIDSRPGL
ncbi:MAG: asparagine synthase (glutamine-hydrolyzing) [Sedimentisphaerales bacterium]|nr:asparagine synthase (glutamine-hydrolyzing) [Sedimentisphaerales bacterium]